MYCKNCLKKISSRSQFCKYCGAPIEQQNQDGELSSEREEQAGQQEQETKKERPEEEAAKQQKREQTNGYSFKLRSERDKEFPIAPKYIAIILSMIAVVAIVVMVLESSVFHGPDGIDYNDYIGIWQEHAGENVEQAGGVRLEILSVDGNTLTISMGFYDGGGAYNSIKAESVGAAIKDGAAYYTFSNDGYGNSGNGVLTFRGRTSEWKSIINKDTPVYYNVVKVSNSVEQPAEAEPSEPPQTEETTENRTEDDYVLPGSDTSYLTEEDLRNMTPEELRIARNEILARHGRRFNDPALTAYFESKDWYKGDVDPETFDNERMSELNDFELKNIALIQSME